METLGEGHLAYGGRWIRVDEYAVDLLVAVDRLNERNAEDPYDGHEKEESDVIEAAIRWAKAHRT